MADITMCKGGDCPLKEQCYRYKATMSFYQSYFVEPPFKDGKCDMFWGTSNEGIYNYLKQVVTGNLKRENKEDGE